MRCYHWFDSTTGILSGRTYADGIGDDARHAASLKNNAPAGHSPIEGVYDHLSQRVDLEKLAADDDAAATAWAALKDANRLARTAGGDPGEDPPPPPRGVPTAAHVVDYQPPAPSSDHEWDATTRRWQLNAAARQKALDQSLARHLESQQHGLMRRLALNPGDVDARAQLQALHDQITGLDGQQP